MRTCFKCQEQKDLTEFYYHNRKWGSAYSAYCKPCHKQDCGGRAKKRLREGDVGMRASKLISAAQRRNKCTISRAWLVGKLERGVCEVTGIPFEIEFNGGRVARPFTPSLDRIDPSKPYTEDNTQVVCWIYNRAKGVNDHSAVVTLAEAIVNGSR